MRKERDERPARCKKVETSTGGGRRLSMKKMHLTKDSVRCWQRQGEGFFCQVNGPMVSAESNGRWILPVLYPCRMTTTMRLDEFGTPTPNHAVEPLSRIFCSGLSTGAESFATVPLASYSDNGFRPTPTRPSAWPRPVPRGELLHAPSALGGLYHLTRLLGHGSSQVSIHQDFGQQSCFGERLIGFDAVGGLNFSNEHHYRDEGLYADFAWLRSDPLMAILIRMLQDVPREGPHDQLRAYDRYAECKRRLVSER
ncbi:hypothetical protein GALMADRAFT_217658 [Galerina marginata CBS 339.88]|uniref:Uncharacterized protein n=1 Tax=Galerina marginata (strain CBS 339.88) TaxID=685588 RepID=A0A067SBL4_GALM3|nr:hypothetical protein GALMADRAFT_217658 [Galerina marginata CBS 339.88]